MFERCTACSHCPCFKEKSWTRWSQEVPSNFSYCLILWEMGRMWFEKQKEKAKGGHNGSFWRLQSFSFYQDRWSSNMLAFWKGWRSLIFYRFKCWNRPWNPISSRFKEENRWTAIENGLRIINFASESVRILLLGPALSKQIIGGFNTYAFSMSLLKWSSHRSHHHSRENAAGRKKDLQTEVLKERRCTETDGELQEPEGITILSADHKPRRQCSLEWQKRKISIKLGNWGRESLCDLISVSKLPALSLAAHKAHWS